MDQLPNFIAYSPLAQQTQHGRTSSVNIQNSRLHLLWELIEVASRQNCLAPSEVLHQALTDDIAVEMPDSLQHRFQKAFQRAALSPLFASWLMGWPIGWTIAEPHASSASATALFRSRLQSHLSCLLKDQEF